jgi:hypothetical protein
MPKTMLVLPMDENEKGVVHFAARFLVLTSRAGQSCVKKKTLSRTRLPGSLCRLLPC